MFPLEKYYYEIYKNEVRAHQTYGGKMYTGKAKCAPEDDFDVEYGMKLAAARCNEKICLERCHALSMKAIEIQNQINSLYEQYNYICKKFKEAQRAWDEAHKFHGDTLKESEDQGCGDLFNDR